MRNGCVRNLVEDSMLNWSTILLGGLRLYFEVSVHTHTHTHNTYTYISVDI